MKSLNILALLLLTIISQNYITTKSFLKSSIQGAFQSYKFPFMAGDISNLIEKNLSCNAGQVLTSITLMKELEQLYYRWDCLDTKVNETALKTLRTVSVVLKQTAGKIQGLDNLYVSCENNYALRSLTLKKGIDPNEIYYEYKCIPLECQSVSISETIPIKAPIGFDKIYFYNYKIFKGDKDILNSFQLVNDLTNNTFKYKIKTCALKIAAPIPITPIIPSRPNPNTATPLTPIPITPIIPGRPNPNTAAPLTPIPITPIIPSRPNPNTATPLTPIPITPIIPGRPNPNTGQLPPFKLPEQTKLGDDPSSLPPLPLLPYIKTGDKQIDDARITSRDWCRTNCNKDWNGPYTPCYDQNSKMIKACSPCKLRIGTAVIAADTTIANNICQQMCASMEPRYDCDFFGFNSAAKKNIPSAYLEKFGLKIVRKLK